MKEREDSVLFEFILQNLAVLYHTAVFILGLRINCAQAHLTHPHRDPSEDPSWMSLIHVASSAI